MVFQWKWGLGLGLGDSGAIDWVEMCWRVIFVSRLGRLRPNSSRISSCQELAWCSCVFIWIRLAVHLQLYSGTDCSPHYYGRRRDEYRCC